MSIHSELLAAGVPLDRHESDLYAKVTPESRAIVAAYQCRSIVTIFKSAIDGTSWYDVPFAFNPDLGLGSH